MSGRSEVGAGGFGFVSAQTDWEWVEGKSIDCNTI